MGSVKKHFKLVFISLLCILWLGCHQQKLYTSPESLDSGSPETYKWRIPFKKYLSNEYPSDSHDQSERVIKRTKKVIKWVWADANMAPLFERDMYVWIGKTWSEKGARKLIEDWPHLQEQFRAKTASFESVEFWGDFAKAKFKIKYVKGYREPTNHTIIWFWDNNRWRIIPTGMRLRGTRMKWFPFFNSLAIKVRRIRENCVEESKVFPKYHSEKFLFRIVKLAEEASKRRGYFPFDMFYLMLFEHSIKIRRYAYEKMNKRYDINIEFTEKKFDYEKMLDKETEWGRKWSMFFDEKSSELEKVKDRDYDTLED